MIRRKDDGNRGRGLPALCASSPELTLPFESLFCSLLDSRRTRLVRYESVSIPMQRTFNGADAYFIAEVKDVDESWLRLRRQPCERLANPGNTEACEHTP